MDSVPNSVCPFYTVDEISPEEFRDRIQLSRPCVIRGFFTPDVVKQYTDHIHRASLEKYIIGNVPAYRMKRSEISPHAYLDALQADDRLVHTDILRIWKHDKDNLTRWHYDGNGSDLLNISLSGSKWFYLSAPDSLPVYPLSNIVPPFNFPEAVKVEIHPGDMLYIPSCWFHKVLTLEDGTMNINYVMFNKHNRDIVSHRHTHLFSIHDLLDTAMDKEILALHPGKLVSFLYNMTEVFPLYLLLIFLYFVIRKYTSMSWVRGYAVLILFLGCAMFGWRTLEKKASGITRILGFYLFILGMIFILCSL